MGTKEYRAGLLSAGYMLVVSTVLLSAVTFAWLVISTAPEISDISTSIATNDSLEIALAEQGDIKLPAASTSTDGAKQGYEKAITWGNRFSMDKDQASADDVFQLLDKTTLKPVSISQDGVIHYPVYGTDGRVKEVGSMTDGNGQGTYAISIDNIPYLTRVDYYLRSSKAGTVHLATEAMDRIAVDTSAGGTLSADVSGKGCVFTMNSDNSAGGGTEKLLNNLRLFFKIRKVSGDAGEGGSEDSILEGKYAALDPNDTSTDQRKIILVNKESNGTITSAATNPLFTIDAGAAGESFLVSMYIYLDGETITNADYKDVRKLGGSINLQFYLTPADGSTMYGMPVSITSSGS